MTPVCSACLILAEVVRQFDELGKYGVCHIIIESSCAFTEAEIAPVVARIAGEMRLDLCCDQAGYSQPKGDNL